MARLGILRRTTQGAFILLLLLAPVFDVLRLDVAARELHVLGHVWSLGLQDGFQADPGPAGAAHVAMRFVLKALLPWILVLSVFPLFGTFLGRSFCGWFCPEGAMFEFADLLTTKTLGRRTLFGRAPTRTDGRAPGGRRWAYGLISVSVLLVIPPLVGVFLSGYFIAPARIWREVVTFDISRGLAAGVIGVWTYMLITSIFVRHGFCKYVCAAGLMQTLFGWASPLSLRLRFARQRFADCTDCRRCEEVCFMDVKPRGTRPDINCVNCARCITACRHELGRRKNLFRLRFGGRLKSRNTESQHETKEAMGPPRLEDAVPACEHPSPTSPPAQAAPPRPIAVNEERERGTVSATR